MNEIIKNPITKGYLTLAKVTPIIQVFFGLYQLQPEPEQTGKLAFFRHTNGTSFNPHWNDVKEKLIRYTSEYYGLKINTTLDFKNVLIELNNQYTQKMVHSRAVEMTNDLNSLFEIFNFSGVVDPGAAFMLSQYFDDGHGLEKLELEHLGKRSTENNPFGITYQTLFASSQMILSKNSDGMELGQLLHDCLKDRALDDAAKVIFLEVESILCCICNEESRSSIRRKFTEMMRLSVEHDIQARS